MPKCDVFTDTGGDSSIKPRTVSLIFNNLSIFCSCLCYRIHVFTLELL